MGPLGGAPHEKEGGVDQTSPSDKTARMEVKAQRIPNGEIRALKDRVRRHVPELCSELFPGGGIFPAPEGIGSYRTEVSGLASRPDTFGSSKTQADNRSAIC